MPPIYELNSMEKKLNKFLQFKAQNTQKIYLQAWRRWQKQKRHNREGAMDYFIKMRREGLADNTIRLHYSVLRAIYEFLVDIGAVKYNPFRFIAKVISLRRTEQVRPTKVIPFDQVMKIIESPPKNTKRGIRDRALLAVLFGCALRRSEVLRLEIRDVMVSPKGTLYLELRKTKAGKRQQQVIPQWTWEYLSVLVSQRKAETENEKAALFAQYFSLQNPTEKAFSESTLVRIYKRYCKTHGIDAAPHSARATAITKLKSDGAQDRDCANFARHGDTQMIKAYDKRYLGLEDSLGQVLKYLYIIGVTNLYSNQFLALGC